VKCPACNETIGLTLKALDREVVSLTIEWEGAFVEARTIGGMIENTRKLLACSAKELGVPMIAMMHSIEWGEKRAVFHFALVPSAQKGAPK
jgi:hypothetical protein